MTNNMEDTGIRYPNINGAEVHVTKKADSSFQHGWRCDGCQQEESLSDMSVVAARSAARGHGKNCTALPPKPPTT